MSTFDSGAFAELEDIYVRLVSGRATDYREIWRAFAGNRRYRAELEFAARRLLRERHLPRQRADDVVHEALLVLARCLERQPNLGFDSRFGPEHFVGWLRTVARSHCQWVMRRQRLSERCRSQLHDEWAGPHAPTVPWRVEFADAVQSLAAPLREVVAAFHELGSIEAAARRLEVSASTAGRRFHAAIKQLRSTCRPFNGSGRLVGFSNATKKW